MKSGNRGKLLRLYDTNCYGTEHREEFYSTVRFNSPVEEAEDPMAPLTLLLQYIRDA
jgi:hypothetical protein